MQQPLSVNIIKAVLFMTISMAATQPVDARGATGTDAPPVAQGVANSAPIIANLNGDSFTYSEGEGARVIDIGTQVTVTDVDSFDFLGGNLTFTITSGEDAAEDTLGVDTSGDVSVSSSTAGSNISVGGVVLGTLGNNIAAGNDLVVNFNINATPARVQTLVRALTYENIDNNNPTTGARNLRITLNDGDGATSANQDVTVTVSAVNDPPLISNLDGDSLDYFQGDGATKLDQGAASTLSDVDAFDFNGGNLTATITSGEDASEDLLSIDGSVTLGGFTAGSSVTIDSVIGTLGNNIAAGNDFVVNFGANATPARVQTLVRALTYENQDVFSATSGARNVRVTVNDGDGGTSANQDITVSVIVPDSDGNLTAAAGVTEPVNLNWSVDTSGEAVDLFDFTLTDGGTADGLAMTVSELFLDVSGTASNSDRSKITWRLNGNDVSNLVGVYNAGTDRITFSSLSISIADGSSETYTINGYFNDNTGLTHAQTVILSIDGDSNLVVGSSGTQMASTSAVSNGTGTVITDDFSPFVTSVSVPANATYSANANLDFTVNFNEGVTVNTDSGTPRLPLTIGTTGRFADYVSGTGTSALLFRAVVVSGDVDNNGISLGASIDPNLGTLGDVAGNNINTTLNNVGSLALVNVDAKSPVLTEVTPVATPDNDSTPNVTISTDEAGLLVVGGSCGSASEGAISSGNSTITLTQPDNSTALAEGIYSDCTITVTDAVANSSLPLTLTSFNVDLSAPVVAEVTAVVTPGNDPTPEVTLSINEAGVLAIGGGCGSADEGDIESGNTTITLTQPDNITALTEGTYSDCTITITDGAGNSNTAVILSGFEIDLTAPIVAEVTPVVTPANDSTPDVTFSSDEAGVLTVGGSCGSADEGTVESGNTTITLTQADNATALADGVYSDCTVTLADSAGNSSNVLNLTGFVIDLTAPVVDINLGSSLANAQTGVVIADSELSASDEVSDASNVSYSLVSVPANGTLRNNGAPLLADGGFTQSDISSSLITYDHDGTETLSDEFAFTLSDELGNLNNNSSTNFTYSFTIGAKVVSQSITFGATPTIAVGGSGMVSATGGASGNPVVFSSQTPGVCTVSGSTVTGVAAGNCSIAANQAGNEDFTDAPEVTQAFSIDMAGQAITFGAAPAVSVGAAGMVSASGGASGNPVIFSSQTVDVCTVSGSTVTGVATGNCTIAADQAGDDNYTAAPQQTQSFTISEFVDSIFCDSFEGLSSCPGAEGP